MKTIFLFAICISLTACGMFNKPLSEEERMKIIKMCTDAGFFASETSTAVTCYKAR